MSDATVEIREERPPNNDPSMRVFSVKHAPGRPMDDFAKLRGIPKFGALHPAGGRTLCERRFEPVSPGVVRITCFYTARSPSPAP